VGRSTVSCVTKRLEEQVEDRADPHERAAPAATRRAAPASARWK
jgi:hypothetical protein